jgi:hypothetical protein
MGIKGPFPVNEKLHQIGYYYRAHLSRLALDFAVYVQGSSSSLRGRGYL